MSRDVTPRPKTPAKAKRRRPVKPVSDRRAAEQPERAELRLRVLRRDRYRCRAIGVIPGHRCARIPGRVELEVHEIIPRSAWAAGYLVDANCVTVCPVAHDWIDANPDDAHDVGLHGYSWERPDPVTGGASGSSVHPTTE